MDMFKQWLMDKRELKAYFANANLCDPLIIHAMKLLEQKVVDGNIFSTPAIEDFKEEAFSKEVEQRCNLPEQVGSNLVLYGTGVKTWLSDPQGPTSYGLKVNWALFKAEYVPTSGAGGCFLPGTRIVIEDGDTTAVEKIKHTTVFGNAGTLGIASNAVNLTTQTDRKIYGFNGERPFFTSDHPFMTQDGWIVTSINPAMNVGQLQIGDSVKKLTNYDQGTQSVTYKWERIINLSSANLPKGSSIYGIKTREGSISCHANRYIANANFPESASNTALFTKTPGVNSFETIYKMPLVPYQETLLN